MNNEFGTEIEATHLSASGQESNHASTTCFSLGSLDRVQQGPFIEVSESDGTFNVYADFRSLPGSSSAESLAVEFAQQGTIFTCGSIQRYVPLPTDAQIEHARVTIDGGIVRMSVPTADLGHRWRSIVMW